MFPAAQLDIEKTGILEDSKMAGCRGPRAIEPCGDRTRRHLSTSCEEDRDDRSSGLMCKSSENSFQVFEIPEALGLGGHAYNRTGW